MSATNQGPSKKRVRWTTETQIFLLLHCMKPTKEIDAAAIAAMIPNATEKSIIEEIAKLIRKRKELDAEVQARLAAAAGPAVAPADVPADQPDEARASKAEHLKEGAKRKRDDDEDESDGETSASDEEEEEEEHVVVPPPRKRAKAVKKAPAKRRNVAFITKQIIYDPD